MQHKNHRHLLVSSLALLALLVVFGGSALAKGKTCTPGRNANCAHADLHDPLLRVSDTFDIASGDLSLPGRVKLR